MDERLIPITSLEDIPSKFLGTPIEILLRSHNLNEKFATPENPQMLISMCMDHRKNLNIPEEFAYILRNAGAFIGDAGFMISYAMTVGGVKTMAIIGHNHCGMGVVKNQGSQIIQGLTNDHGWTQNDALSHYNEGVAKYAIPGEIDAVLKMAQNLKLQYENLLVVPMMYLLEDNKLYLIK